jgi:hypothetical protein
MRSRDNSNYVIYINNRIQKSMEMSTYNLIHLLVSSRAFAKFNTTSEAKDIIQNDSLRTMDSGN